MKISSDNRSEKLIPVRFHLLIIAITLVPVFFSMGTSLGVYYFNTGKAYSLRYWALSIANDKLKFIPNIADGLKANPEKIVIDIKFMDFQKIAYQRHKSLRRKIIVEGEDDWVPAKIRYKDTVIPAQIKLKGTTWLHWNRDDQMWSFRIKLKGNNTILGMKKFAIQHPRTRGFLDEWVFHKLLKDAGLIGLRYNFIIVSINGKRFPVYALEENFSKELIENNRLREGPIFKYRNNDIEPYQLSRIKRDSVLSEELDRVQKLLSEFETSKTEPSNIFDIKKMAMFFAIEDLMGYYHATSLNNLRFYYNPITGLIEPVGYDNSSYSLLEKKEERYNDTDLIAIRHERYKNDSFKDKLFSDKDFFKYYLSSLEKISDSKFINKFLRKIQPGLHNNLSILHISYPWYNLNSYLRHVFTLDSVDILTALKENSTFIRKVLSKKDYGIYGKTLHIKQEPALPNYRFIEIDKQKKIISIKKGEWKILNDIIVPEGFYLKIDKGTKLLLANYANIISHGPVIMRGAQNEKITIESTDNTGGALLMLEASEMSYLENVEIRNLNVFKKPGRNVTAAITFYKSPVTINNCVLESNITGDDLINIVRSEFSINNTEFINARSDSLDTDFSNGEIANSTFLNSGNDAIDTSGSKVTISNVKITGANDKALSFGENSKITIQNVSINKSHIAMASKDLSEVVADSLDISDTDIGFVVFQKKTEYGEASVKITNYTGTDITTETLVEHGSETTINNRKIQDYSKNIKEFLYN